MVGSRENVAEVWVERCHVQVAAHEGHPVEVHDVGGCLEHGLCASLALGYVVVEVEAGHGECRPGGLGWQPRESGSADADLQGLLVSSGGLVWVCDGGVPPLWVVKVVAFEGDLATTGGAGLVIEPMVGYVGLMTPCLLEQ